MTLKRSKFFCTVLVVFSIVLLGTMAIAGSYPDKEIRVIIAYGAGGTSDQQARPLARILRESKDIPKPLLITNMPGAGTRDALYNVARSRPDGYTLLMHHTAFLTMEAMGRLPKELLWHESFTPIMGTLDTPITVVVRKDAPWKTMKDLIADAKKRPGEISWALAGGIGSVVHFTAELIWDETGTKDMFKPIVYPGGAKARAAQLGGHVDVRTATSLDAMKSGSDVRILGITAEERVAALPDVPTMREQGIDVTFALRSGLFAPKNTPQDRIVYLREKIGSVIQNDDWKAFAESMAAVGVYRTGDEFSKVFEQDSQLLKNLATKLNLK